MSRIITTAAGRFRQVSGNEHGWLWECPCGEWANLSKAQWAGAVSVNHAADGCPVGYHETHNYEAALAAAVIARILVGEQPYEEEYPS